MKNLNLFLNVLELKIKTLFITKPEMLFVDSKYSTKIKPDESGTLYFCQAKKRGMTNAHGNDITSDVPKILFESILSRWVPDGRWTGIEDKFWKHQLKLKLHLSVYVD